MAKEYTLTISPGRVNFAPENELEEVAQNILMICTTGKYTVPMDREFGVEGLFVDEPDARARAKYAGEVVRAVRKYEPRARVGKIEYEPQKNIDGHIYPRVKFRLV